jgi:predicted LPLAT superfamily acyltransferase/glycosyltransferase involved in cell wall biosynthesis
MTALRLCAVIPTCNHTTALDAILTRLDAAGLATIVIDDGSFAANAEMLRTICARHPNSELQRHSFNGGKGFAVMCGLARAAERGFSHAVQVDADGQHDLDALGALIHMAERNPGAIVTGAPIYDASAPAKRRLGRKFTTFWIRINTLSFRLPDAMCGFRIYPVEKTLALVRKSVRGLRMDFDVEVLVKAHWARITVAPVPVKVIYPEGNLSNFQMVADNVRLAKMQTRLFFGMLWRAPSLLFSKPPRIIGGEPTRWSVMRERGAGWGLHLLAAVYRLLGRTVCLAVMVPVILYFFLTGREQREASRDFLDRMWRAGHLVRKPTSWTSFRHFLAFGGSALDKFAAWTGGIPHSKLHGDGVAALNELVAKKQGAFIITAHVGNPDVVRAIGVLGKAVPLNVLVHTEHAEMFNKLIAQFSPEAPVRAIPVTKVGADTAILLSDAIARGEWVVMVGDRVPVSEGGRVVEVPFFGAAAAFPQGPYVLASVLKAPVYLLFCARERGGFEVRFTKFADRIDLPRRDRMGTIRQYAEQYARALEVEVAARPLQWFNFYSFWHMGRSGSTGGLQKAAS